MPPPPAFPPLLLPTWQHSPPALHRPHNAPRRGSGPSAAGSGALGPGAHRVPGGQLRRALGGIWGSKSWTGGRSPWHFMRWLLWAGHGLAAGWDGRGSVVNGQLVVTTVHVQREAVMAGRAGRVAGLLGGGWRFAGCSARRSLLERRVAGGESECPSTLTSPTNGHISSFIPGL